MTLAFRGAAAAALAMLAASESSEAQVACRTFFADANGSAVVDTGSPRRRPERTGRRIIDVTRPDPELVPIQRRLNQNVIGQPHLIRASIDALTAAKSGMVRRGAAGSILVYGPTGIGKTLTFEELAAAIGGSLIRIEGGNFMNDADVSSLTGASPQWTGHGTTVPVITQEQIDDARGSIIPVTIVLINELDKVHQDFLDWWLKALDDGENTIWVPNAGDGSINNRGSSRRTIDFRDVILVATANTAADIVARESDAIVSNVSLFDPNALRSAFGVADLLPIRPPSTRFQSEARAAFIQAFKRPEFLGRWDEILPAFPMLDRGYERIFSLEIRRVQRQLAELHPIRLRASLGAARWIVQSADRTYGARSLSRLVDRLVATPLARAVATGQINPHDRVAISLAPDESGLEFTARDGEGQEREEEADRVPRVRSATPRRDQTVTPRAAAGAASGSSSVPDIQATIESIATRVMTPVDRLRAWFHFLYGEPTLSSEQALRILQSIPYGVNRGWSNQNLSPLFDMVAANGLGRHSPLSFEYMDIQLVFQTLNAIGEPMTFWRRWAIREQANRIIRRSGAQYPAAVYADLNALLEILIARNR